MTERTRSTTLTDVLLSRCVDALEHGQGHIEEGPWLADGASVTKVTATSVRGTVRSSRGYVEYDVELLFRDRDDRDIIYGVCSCAVGVTCKHVYALALKYRGHAAVVAQRRPYLRRALRRVKKDELAAALLELSDMYLELPEPLRTRLPGWRNPMSRVYDDLETMFLDRGIKQRKDGSFAEDSYDLGVWWHDEGGGQYRLTWIGPRQRKDPGKAGELYLVCLQPPLFASIPLSAFTGARVGAPLGARVNLVAAGKADGMVEVICRIPPACTDELESVFDRDIGGRNDPAATVERVLDGWAEVCGGKDSVSWLRQRVAEAVAAGEAFPVGSSCAISGCNRPVVDGTATCPHHTEA